PGPEGGADAAGVLGPAASGQDTDGGIARGVVHLGAQQQRNLVEVVEGGTRARHAARETQTDQNLDGTGETDRCHDGTLFFVMSFLTGATGCGPLKRASRRKVPYDKFVPRPPLAKSRRLVRQGMAGLCSKPAPKRADEAVAPATPSPPGDS